MSEQEKRIIVTTAPIQMDLLKLKFTEDVHYVIDYEQSKFKGKVLITYLTNLNLSCEIQFGCLETELEMLKEYLALGTLVNLPQMEEVTLNLLLAVQGKENILTFDPTEFINENFDVLNRWLINVNMLPTYALQCHPKLKDMVQQFEEVEDSLVGINFVNLIKHWQFPVLVSDIDESEWCWNKLFFTEPCFAGKPMFDFYQDKNNPYFVSLLALDSEENFAEFDKALNEGVAQAQRMYGEMNHVSLN